MSDKPAINEPEVTVKPPAKAGESTLEPKLASDKSHLLVAQNEATKRLFAASTLPLAPHHAAETSPAKPPAEQSSWSFSALTTRAENAVTGYFKPEDKSLPRVHLVAEKPAAPAIPPISSSSEHTSLIERAVGAVTNFSATKKAAADYYHQLTSGKMSTTDKLFAAGTVGLAAVALVAPEAKGLKAGLELESSAAEHSFSALSAARTPGRVGLNSLRAFKEQKAVLTEAEKLGEGTRFIADGSAATKPAQGLKFAPAEFKPTEVAKPFAAAKPDVLSGINLGEPEATLPRFAASTAKPQRLVQTTEPEVHTVQAKPFESHEPHLVAPAGGPGIESKIVTPLKVRVGDAPVARVSEPGTAAPVARVSEPRTAAPVARVSEPGTAARVEAPTPSGSPKPVISRIEPAATPKAVPNRAASVEGANTARLSEHAPPTADATREATKFASPAAETTAVVRHETHAPAEFPAVVRHETHAPAEFPAVVKHETHAPAEFPAVVKHETHAAADVPAAVKIETHAAADVPAAVKLETHAAADVPAAVKLETHAPADVPAAVKLETHVPADAPAAVKLETHAPADVPAAVKLETRAAADVPAAVKLETPAAADVPAAVKLETRAAADVPAAVKLETRAAADVPAAVKLETRAAADVPAAVKLETRAAADVPAAVKLEAQAPAEVFPQPKIVTASNLEVPAARLVEPADAAAFRPADVPTARSAAALSADVSRAENTVAETQIVSRSNALAENVHKLELPANASPELQAAKVRMRESSLLIPQSADRAKVLEGMEADLKVLEKSFTPETVREIRQSIAEIQSSTSSLERSTVRTVEEPVAHARLTEAPNTPIQGAQSLNRGTLEEPSRLRRTENVETQTANTIKPTTETSTQAASSAVTQAPHAVSIQNQSLKLLENPELAKPSREAISKIIQDTNNWGAKSLAQRSEAVARLDENLKVLSADAGTAKELSTITKSVESLKVGTNAETVAIKADTEIGKSTSRLVPQATEPAELHTSLRANHMRSEVAADSHAAEIAHRQELQAATAQLREHSVILQEQTLGVIEKGGLNAQSRKALVNVVQDSGNISTLEGAERAVALRRIEQNLKIVSQDEGIAADARNLTRSFDALETSSTKAQRLEQFDKISTETLPRIADETAALRKSHPTTSATADRVDAHLKSIENDAASLKYSSNKSETLSAMQGNVDRLEGALGKDAVAPLRENVDRLDMAHRGSARAKKIEETAAQSLASKDSLNSEMRTLSEQDAKLSTASRGAAEDVQVLTSTTQRFEQAEVTRLKEGVGVVSREVEPTVSARLGTHVYNVETNHQLNQLDRALANVAEGTATINRQTAIAAARNSNPAVAELHQATESLRLNGVAELSAARVAYEKALPALGREDAININRSLNRIEAHTVEAQSWKHQIAEAQQARIAVVERNAHFYPQNESQRAREIQQIVVSPRDRVVEDALKRAETARNTSDLAVFKPATHAVSDVPVVGLSSIGSRWREISAAAQEIATSFRNTIFEHSVARSFSIGMGAFMVESGRALAQTPVDNIRQTNAGQFDFSPRIQNVAPLTEVSPIRGSAGVAADSGSQQPLVRGMLAAEYASLSPTTQAFLRTPDGGIFNGNRVRSGNTMLFLALQSGVPQEVIEKAVVYSKVVKASSIPLGQADSTEKDRSRIFYPPFKSPLASISAKVRKPQNFLGTELVSLANSTSFLNSKLTPGTASLTNPLNFTREMADSTGEERANGGPVSAGSTLDLANNASSASTALLNAASADPSAQTVAQSATSEA